MRACADPARPHGWIDESFVAAYGELHRLGLGAQHRDLARRRARRRALRRGDRWVLRGRVDVPPRDGRVEGRARSTRVELLARRWRDPVRRPVGHARTSSRSARCEMRASRVPRAGWPRRVALAGPAWPDAALGRVGWRGRAAQPRRSPCARLPAREGAHDARRVPVEPQRARVRVQPVDEPLARWCSYDEPTVEAALDELRERSFVRRGVYPGSRVIKYRHVLDEALGIGPPELALLCVMLLRGPQTPGELKSRTERLHPFKDLVGDRGRARPARGARRAAGPPAAARAGPEGGPGPGAAHRRRRRGHRAVPEDAPVEWKPDPRAAAAPATAPPTAAVPPTATTGSRRGSRPSKPSSRRSATELEGAARHPRWVDLPAVDAIVVYHNPVVQQVPWCARDPARAGDRGRRGRVPEGAAGPRHARAHRRRDPEPAGRARAQGQAVQGARARRARTTRRATTVVELLLAHPELMERPVVFRGERAVIARPSELVLELVDGT